jgi:hypothetical protein
MAETEDIATPAPFILQAETETWDIDEFQEWVNADCDCHGRRES